MLVQFTLTVHRNEKRRVAESAFREFGAIPTGLEPTSS